MVQTGGGRKRKTSDQSNDRAVRPRLHRSPSNEQSGAQSGAHSSRCTDRAVRPRRHRSPPALPSFTRVRTRKSFKDLIW